MRSKIHSTNTVAKNNNVQMSQAMVSRDNKMKRMSRRVTVMCPSSGSDVSSGLPCTIITMPRGPVRKHSVIELSSDDENIPRKPVAKRPKKPGAVCAEVLEISSDDEQPRPVSKHVVDQLSKLQHDYAKLQKDHEKEVTDLKAQLRLRQASSSSKLDPQDLEDHVCCEICTAKMWVPYMLDCGHAFCGQCLTDWFQTSLNNHHARYPTNPALVPMLNLLRTANPEQQHNIRRQFGHLLPPDVEYTCPTCRNKVHRKPIEAFALKALVRKVASAQGEESPRKEAAPIAGRSRKRGARAPPARSDPFSQFFP
ncbi:hypothetical protein DL96DRAFT_1149114 [Flagelloscypha sp. PMI_526]|nr:hypothetical protein DL96DRAFT_1149114 [Flagelloscypha sp. PMI_526]